jgi:hypothetical protein
LPVGPLGEKLLLGWWNHLIPAGMRQEKHCGFPCNDALDNPLRGRLMCLSVCIDTGQKWLSLYSCCEMILLMVTFLRPKTNCFKAEARSTVPHGMCCASLNKGKGGRSEATGHCVAQTCSHWIQ